MENSHTLTDPNSFYTFTISRSPKSSIIDNLIVTDNIFINQNGRLEYLSIDVDISHSYIGDLIVTLTAPDNRVVRLHARTGQSTDDIVTTYPTLTSPVDNLAIFNGMSIMGTWKLSVNDLAIHDQGTFNAWSLNLYYSSLAPITTTRLLTTSTSTTKMTTSANTRSTTRFQTNSTRLTSKNSLAFLSIPDLGSISDVITIMDYGRLTAIIIEVEITHPYIGDLVVRLIAPDNTFLELHNREGGTSDNIKTSYPFSTLPYGNLSVFLNGKSIYGNWILSVSDQANLDQGILNSWGLKLFYTSISDENLLLNIQRTPVLSVLDFTTVNDTVFVNEIGRITSISVQVDITHTYIGDLVVRLISPDNTVIVLHNRSGGSQKNIQTSYPPTVSFNSLSLLNEKSISGSWTLSVSDQAFADQGVFNSWSLAINYDNQH
jgi:subtilisin-like proprotein convertase family protein